MMSIVVVTTVGDEEQGNLIARELIARRHAACVNMVSGVKSFYRWKGKICHDSEFMLIIKTMADEYDQVAATIHELHSYELPEILAFNIAKGDPPFLEWVANSLDKEAPFEEEEEEEAEFPDLDLESRP
ncbi:MAG: divalent-cation tolerance protein CutA [bacterium]|nr:divalent-cation tolerance protein CutA [bacterium]